MTVLLVLIGATLIKPAEGDAVTAHGAARESVPGRSDLSRPVPHRNSVLYVGRGKGIKRVSFRLRGRQLIEANILFLEHCSITGRGHGRRYRHLVDAEEATRRRPLRVDGHGHFRAYRWEVDPSSDEFEKFVGAISPRLIVGSIAGEFNYSAPESGVFLKCKTGPLGEAREKLTFKARATHPNTSPRPNPRDRTSRG